MKGEPKKWLWQHYGMHRPKHRNIGQRGKPRRRRQVKGQQPTGQKVKGGNGPGRENGLRVMGHTKITRRKKKMASHFILLVLVIATCSVASASDPSPLQDFCVADPNGPVLVNGFACKDPKLVQAEDFFFKGLHLPGNTSNPVGSKVSPVTVSQIPGLNTQGISLARADFAPWGINPPHTHPRATEILTVIQGSLEVGFVTSNPENKLIGKILQTGDVFVFPKGLIHFQRNVGYGNAVAIVGLSSQNPGVNTIGNAVFGSKPGIASDALAKSFQVDGKTIDWIQSKFI